MKLFEMSAGNFGSRPWYHGTSKKVYDKVMSTGYLIPSLADDKTFGDAVWFTSDLEEARSYGKYVFEIKNGDVAQFKNKKISELPHGFKKKYEVKPSRYHLVVLEKIPVRYLNLV